MKNWKLWLGVVMVGLMAGCGQQTIPTSSSSDSRITVQAADTNFIYYLPYLQGASYVVTQDYDPYAGGQCASTGGIGHSGGCGVLALDFAMPTGTTVLAARGGTARLISEASGNACGNYVKIEQDDGSNAFYCHLSQFSIANNATVPRGAEIGKSGSTGNITGPHLHFEVSNGASFGFSTGTVKVKFKEVSDDGRCSNAFSGACYPVNPNAYVSQNSVGTIVIPPPPPPPSIAGSQFFKQGTNLTLNTRPYPGLTFSWLWNADSSDSDQLWDVFPPAGFTGGTNGGWMFRQKGTHCLNAYQPGNGTEIIAFSCNPADGDQQWTLGYMVGWGAYRLETRGYCLDAPTASANARVRMWDCNGANQKWNVTGVPGPIFNASGTAMGSMADVGQTPAARTLTLTNTGGVVGGRVVGGPAPYNITKSATWFNVSAGTLDLSRGVDALNPSTTMTVTFSPCTAPVSESGNFTVNGAGSNTVTISVARTCTNAPIAVFTPSATALTLPAGTVGGTTSSATFTLQNTGNTSGTYSLASSNSFTISPTTGTLGVGSSATITVIAPACSAVTTQTSSVTGAASAVAVTRVCTAAPPAVWTTAANTAFAAGTVGGATASVPITLTNTGNAAGNYTVSATNGFLASPSSGTLAVGASVTITATAPVCTSTANQTAVITFGGSSSASNNLTRGCIPAIPLVPSGLTLNVSSNGRMFVSWTETGNTTDYEFAGTFDGSALTFSTPVTARGAGSSGAVMLWNATPEDPAKQGKQLCVQIRARNSGGSSALASAVCAPYRYYTAVSVQSVSTQPTVVISLP